MILVPQWVIPLLVVLIAGNLAGFGTIVLLLRAYKREVRNNRLLNDKVSYLSADLEETRQHLMEERHQRFFSIDPPPIRKERPRVH